LSLARFGPQNQAACAGTSKSSAACYEDGTLRTSTRVCSSFLSLSFVAILGACVVAGPIPVIRGIVPDFTDPTFVVLFEDDGNGVFDPGAESVAQAYSSTDGFYEFGSLSASAGYYVGVGENVSELIYPGALTNRLDDFLGALESAADPTTTSVTAGSLADAIGGSRRLTSVLDSGSGYIQLSASAFDDTLRFASGTGAQGTGYITWDGSATGSSETPAMGLGGLDLTAAGTIDAFCVYTGFDSASVGTELVLRIYEGDASNYSEAAVDVPINNGLPTEFVTFAFDDFVGSVTADNVDAIQLIIRNAPGSADGQIAEFGLVDMEITPTFFESVIAVPEPTSSFSICLIGTLGIALARRKRTAITKARIGQRSPHYIIE
ncbi:MAG: PEP-CTERM sorting domain-containing protein, partial [Planctomycetales bacterium]|nr:PEP-CTERM sorting domain-containing protein [Planctomycetales bacterium]